MDLKRNTENSNKKSNSKIILIIVVLLIGVFIIIFNKENNKENNEENFFKKLSDSWSNETGVTITFHENTTCDVYFNLKEYSDTVETSNCKYEIVDNKIMVSFDVKIILPNYEEDTFIWEFEYDQDLKNLTRIDKDASSSDEARIFKRGVNSYKEDSVEEPKYDKKPYYREYNLTGTTDGSVAKITFQEDNKCTVDLSSLRRTVNLGGYKSDYMYINYYDGECTYEETNDKELTIHYMGAFDVFHDGRYVNYKSYIVQNDNQEIKIHFSDDYSTFEKTNGSFKMANYAIYFDGAVESATIQYGQTYSTHSHTAWFILNQDGTGTHKYESLGGPLQIDVTYEVNGNHLNINGPIEENSLICTIEDDNNIECSPKDRPGLTSEYLVNHNTETCEMWDSPQE